MIFDFIKKCYNLYRRSTTYLCVLLVLGFNLLIFIYNPEIYTKDSTMIFLGVASIILCIAICICHFILVKSLKKKGIKLFG